MTFLLLLAGLGVASPAPPAPADGPPAIVGRSIEFHGGERYTSSRTRLKLCSLSGCYDLDVTVDGGRFAYRVEGPRGEERWVVHNQGDGTKWDQALLDHAIVGHYRYDK